MTSQETAAYRRDKLRAAAPFVPSMATAVRSLLDCLLKAVENDDASERQPIGNESLSQPYYHAAGPASYAVAKFQQRVSSTRAEKGLAPCVGALAAGGFRAYHTVEDQYGT